ncbi:hypothetical protein KCU74_g4431, partial [Aureobasidium melanogenum]
MKKIEDSNPEDLDHEVDEHSRLLRIKHKADIYNTILRYGWGSEDFEREACMAVLSMMEKQYDKEEKRLMDMVNPDAHLFDN